MRMVGTSLRLAYEPATLKGQVESFAGLARER